jgi:hypothetical protein
MRRRFLLLACFVFSIKKAEKYLNHFFDRKLVLDPNLGGGVGEEVGLLFEK